MARIINTADLTETSALDHNAKDWVYNGLDCCVTLEIRDELLPQLDNVTRHTYEFSRALQAPVLEMTMRGLLVDKVKRADVLKSFQKQIDRLDKQLTRIVKEGIGAENLVVSPKADQRWWRSPTKLKTLLYDIMGLPVQKKRNANGIWAPTTDRDALEKLDEHFVAQPVTRHMLSLRDIDKKRGFLESGLDPDGHIRCNFNIAGTNTGRLASSLSDFGSGTNLQNVDRELRSVCVSERGRVYVNLDLEQGDSRNVGAICWNLFVHEFGEKYAGSYLDACESGDLHTTVCRMSRTELPWTGDLKADKKIAEQLAYRQDTYRQLAKKLGHGSNYYGTPRTMAKHTKVITPIIQEFQQRYFGAFPVIGCYDPNNSDPDHKLPNWHNNVRRQLQTSHTLTTMLGRRRKFWGRAFDDATLREAIAYEPQGMTADEIDTALLKLQREGKRFDVWLHVQVHDSILMSIPEEMLDEFVPWALKLAQTQIILEKGREFFVPTEAKIGWNWGDFDTEKNVDGLKKWSGKETRIRTEFPRTGYIPIFDLE